MPPYLKMRHRGIANQDRFAPKSAMQNSIGRQLSGLDFMSYDILPIT
jgi:hypothetical protein